jgi:hypothetical protein
VSVVDAEVIEETEERPAASSTTDKD